MGKRGPAKGSPRVGGRQPGTVNKKTLVLAEIAREHTDEMIGYYLEIIRTKQPMLDAEGKPTSEEEYKFPNNHRIECIDRILDRGWGKPTQDVNLSGSVSGSVTVEHVHSIGDLKVLPSEELLKRLRTEVQLKVVEHEPLQITKKVA